MPQQHGVGKKFDPGLGVHSFPDLSFSYDSSVFGPQPEMRRLDAIRSSLKNPQCDGPDVVYSIVMDVGREEHRQALAERMLLFGVVAYAAGRLGDEPVRSQGHVHAIAPHSGWSPPELFEIWEGTAIIYAQEKTENDPGRCIAITASAGDKVVMPPGWAHFVANADPKCRMIFGAWCDRQYGFVYDAVRAHGGLAWFPVVNADSSISWEPNASYQRSKLSLRSPRQYPELGLDAQAPIYAQFAANPERLQWVSKPSLLQHLWSDFEP
jgi:glucose-6-phosphate isomerase